MLGSLFKRAPRPKSVVKTFVWDESPSVIDDVKQTITGRTSGSETACYNVWWVTYDFEQGTVELEHDFDPVEASMPISEFVATLESLEPPKY